MQTVRVLGSFFILPLVLLAIAAAPARAQSLAQPNSWTVTPFIGTSADVSGPATDNSLGLGVGVGYDLTPYLAFEGELAHLFDVAGNDANLDWSVTNVSGNVLYHFNVQHVTPYVTFGLGFEHSNLDYKNPDPAALTIPSSTEVAYNFGGGVKYRLNDSLIVRGDLRRFQAVDLAPDHWRVYGGVVFDLRR